VVVRWLKVWTHTEGSLVLHDMSLCPTVKITPTVFNALDWSFVTANIWFLCSVHGRLGLRQQVPAASRNAFNGSSRLFAAAIPQPEKPALSKFDARQKLSGQNPSKVVDARQKLLQKTKFADARQRIEKKLQVQSDTASDMRTKLLAKRRFGQSTAAAAAASTTTAGKTSAAGPQLAKSTSMLVTVSNKGRIASAVTGGTSAVGNKTVASDSISTSRLVSTSIHFLYIMQYTQISVVSVTVTASV